MRKYNFETANQIIKLKNGTLLSENCNGVYDKITIRCNVCDNEWITNLNNVNNKKRWCPKCGINKLANLFKYSFDYVNKYVSSRGGELITKKYTNNKTKLHIKCEVCKYEWHPCFSDIHNTNKWCPKCSGRPSFTIEDCKTTAEKNNGFCLENFYKNCFHKMKWMCNFGHIWYASFSSIKNHKTWCPECNKKSKNQNKLFDIIKNIFPKYKIYYNFRGFDWLKTSKNGKQEIDIYVKEIKLAIEYDGEQHFMPIKIFGGIEKFKKNKKLDDIKNKKIQENINDVNVFIRFNYKEKITENFVIEKLKNAGITIP